MRYLNKIILINSANVKYAEISLDGNVHFIGTQGVGKSTLLRTILFFYNADTFGLGIPKQKTSYTDYYFQKSNAYVIYEVIRSDGKFCVVSYKSQHKVCFRFFDGEFKQEYFVNENGNVPDGWDGIAQKLDANKVFYTKRKIDEYKEYRDIIYGNHEGKKNELKRYSIMESKDYQYIPKTIQNVFLNSKMDAEFIKQTIIMSLENDIRIDLNNYLHHLKNFETQINDIRKFKTPGTTSQANSIAQLHIAIRHLEREKTRIAKELVWALNRNEEEEPELKRKLETENNKKAILSGKINKLADAFKSKENKIRGEISVHDNQLKTAKNKSDDYERKNIHSVIERVSKKPAIEKEQNNLLEEKELLSTQFKELTQKFKSLLDKQTNQWNDFLNGKNAERNTINSDFLNYKELQRNTNENLIAEISTEYKIQIDNARDNWENKKRETGEFKIQKEGIKYKRFFEMEIKLLEKSKADYSTTIQKYKTDNENYNRQIETIQKIWALDTQDLQRKFEHEKEKLHNLLENASQNLSEIEIYLENSKNSLYGWLTDQYPGWENTIGKVIDEKNVLFQAGLSPMLIDNTKSFYGIDLDLNEINKTVKTVSDYEMEKMELIQFNKQTNKAISDLIEKLEKDKDNLKRKHQPKIREKKDTIKEYDYLKGINQSKLDEATVKLGEMQAKAESEKNKSFENINQLIEKSVESELKAKEEVVKVEEELAKQIKIKEKGRDKKIEAERERIHSLLVNLDAEIKTQRASNLKRNIEINHQKDTELSKKGADTKRLNEIEERLSALKNELEFIEQNRDTVSDYKKDKRELFDKTDEFKSLKQLLEKQLEQEKKKHTLQKEILGKELNKLQEIINHFSQLLSQIVEDSESFENFNGTDCYQTIHQYFSHSEENFKIDKRVNVLIDEIKDIHYDKLNNRTDEMKRIITDFLGKFSDDNIFKFKKQLTDTNSFLVFSEMLSDFVEEKKVERIEKEVNERFALIITTIGTETNNLVAASGKIQTVITKINNDFVERNFAGVIRKIELKVDDSKNEVVQLLILIKKFNDENQFDLGQANLFSSENQEKKNKEATDLLKQFVKKIAEMKRDYIMLSDSFELKFRIEENLNDTGWVEKLSNVGSDGTDVLVKAMLNIMLLNVFKEGASKRFKDFQLHCMMDEIGKLHPTNVRGILKFANDRNILLINGSPIENDALAFKHIYKLRKDEQGITKVNRIMTQLK
ncbi:MAG: ATP-binding protein [Ginsengibacter sp.]